MKKLLFALLVLGATFANAQAPTGPAITNLGNMLSTPTHATTDTITNTTVKAQYAIVKGVNQHVTVQCTLTKISGTVAGTVKLQGSIDGVVYNDVPGAGTFTLTDVASQNCAFYSIPSIYQYYKILVTPSGTQSTKIVSRCLVRKN